MSKVSEYCLEQTIKFACWTFKYSLLSLHKSSLHVKLCKIWQNLRILPNFQLEHTVKVTATIICTQTYPEEIQHGYPRLDNDRQPFGWLIDRSVQRFLAESNSRLARVSAGQCLKFCDDTPSVATFPTLLNCVKVCDCHTFNKRLLTYLLTYWIIHRI